MSKTLDSVTVALVLNDGTEAGKMKTSRVKLPKINPSNYLMDLAVNICDKASTVVDAPVVAWEEIQHTLLANG